MDLFDKYHKVVYTYSGGIDEGRQDMKTKKLQRGDKVRTLHSVKSLFGIIPAGAEGLFQSRRFDEMQVWFSEVNQVVAVKWDDLDTTNLMKAKQYDQVDMR